MKTILVAEDDHPSRELLLAILEGQGYQVSAAADGGEAVRLLGNSSPDLILLDIQMPVMDGFAVLSWIRQNSRLASVPVIALTAYAMREDQDRIRSAGFNSHVSKPLNRTELLARIEEFLAASSKS